MGSAADFEDRVAQLRSSAAFENYEWVRERVFRLRDLEGERTGGVYSPSEYWAEELHNFEYMLDAGPLIIDKLREHTFHVTGLKVYDYRSNKDAARALLAEKLEALGKLEGDELLVPEARELGGFGFELDGALYNVDTLKFYEVMIALQRGEVLAELRDHDERKLVWEIGAGWGGFAYQFKTVCPHVTYVIMDFPELFLFSAVYLKTLFPEARIAIHDAGPLGDVLNRWRELDFIFVSNTFLEEFRPQRLDLAINMVSFQEMTGAQVEAYVGAARSLGAPYLYSLNRDRSPYNTELSSVSEIIERHFWPHEIELLPVAYTKMLNKVKKAKQLKAKIAGGVRRSPNDYRHIIGWQRMQT